MLKAVIIDDEHIGINTLRLLIEKHTTGLEVAGTATEPDEGIALINNLKPDVLFIDISMPKMDGFEFLTRLDYNGFKLVFTTAHYEYAIQAIKSRAHDYLLKPIDIEQLKNCVNGLFREKESHGEPGKQKRVVGLSVKDGIIFIRPDEVIRLEASGSYTVFYLENNIRHVASKNLKECERMFSHPHFFRSHSSHIINLTKVIKMQSQDGLFALMSDGSRPEISRRNKEEFLERLKKI